MRKIHLLSPISLAFTALALSSTANAAIVGQSSNSEYITAGESITGDAGIDVPLFDFVTNLQSGLGGLGIADLAVEDEDGIHHVNLPYGESLDLGVFTFAQVGDQDIWFGEWSESGNHDDTTRTVFYSGANADSVAPTSGSAAYGVTAINSNLGGLSGTVIADFNAGTLSGSIANSLVNENGTTSSVIQFSGANINSDASVTGNNVMASFYREGAATSFNDGTISAQFYNGVVDIAGLFDFEGTEFDTAFGGSVVRWLEYPDD